MSDASIEKVNLAEIGVTGLKRYGDGAIYEEFLPSLQGEKGRQVYREMSDNDPVVGAFLFAVDMLIRQVDWRTLPADESPQARKDADFVESCRTDMSHTWPDLISEILSMLPYGWSFHEVVYKRRQGPNQKDPSRRSKHNDGLIGWRKMPIRSQDTLHEWKFDENGGIRGMVQLAPPEYQMVEIPITKGLLFRSKVYKNSPEGRSILRNAYRPWLFKKRIEEFEGIGIERDLAGIPVMWADPKIMRADATDDEKALLAALVQVVTNVRRDTQEGLVLPLAYDERGHKLYDFQLLGSGGQRQFSTSEVISRYDQRIAMSMLSDFLMLGHNQHGSFAMASSRSNLLTLAIAAWIESIAAVFNEIAIPALFKMNGWERDAYPSIGFGDIATPDLNELGNYLVQLSNAGSPLFPDDRLEEHLRQAAKLPPPSIPAEQRAKEAQKRQPPPQEPPAPTAPRQLVNEVVEREPVQGEAESEGDDRSDRESE